MQALDVIHQGVHQRASVRELPALMIEVLGGASDRARTCLLEACRDGSGKVPRASPATCPRPTTPSIRLSSPWRELLREMLEFGRDTPDAVKSSN